MLYFAIFGFVMLVLVFKSLVETTYGVILIFAGLVLIVIGYLIKSAAFIVKIYSALEARSQNKKVCFP